jgi:HEAT repeat protein
LLDARLREMRCSKRWKKKAALIALGQTRAHEAIAPLVGTLESDDLDLRTAAVRGLGAIGTVEAAIPLLERMTTGELNVPVATASTALVSCCKSSPATLLRFLHLAENKNRELMARVLAETDLGNLGEELVSLACDSNPEIRACAARGLGKLDPTLSLLSLTNLSIDDVWFVRLRAVIALGGIDEPASTDALLQALCDSNRLVRQRAAAALVRRSQDIRDILRQAISLNDSYGLQALISEMERQGTSESMLREARLRENASLGKSIDSAREELRLAAAGAR